MAAAIPAIINMIGQVLPGILQIKGVGNSDAMKITADLQAKMAEAQSQDIQALATVDQAQNATNQAELAAGKAGWRNWLGCGLTLAVLYSLLGLPILKTLAALLYFLGASPDHILQFCKLLPIIDTTEIWPVLMGMLGLYAARGVELFSHAKLNK